MIYKKAQTRNDAAAGYLVLFVVGILLLYFLSKFLLHIGIIFIFLGLVLLIFGFNGEENLLLAGIILIIVGIVSSLIGLGGVNFFEKNPVGSDLLKTSQGVINATAGTYIVAQNTQKEISNAQTETISQVTDSLKET